MSKKTMRILSVLAGVLRTVEAESGLCVKADMSVTFLTEE